LGGVESGGALALRGPLLSRVLKSKRVCGGSSGLQARMERGLAERDQVSFERLADLSVQRAMRIDHYLRKRHNRHAPLCRLRRNLDR
jgi:hypothetical protein